MTAPGVFKVKNFVELPNVQAEVFRSLEIETLKTKTQSRRNCVLGKNSVQSEDQIINASDPKDLDTRMLERKFWNSLSNSKFPLYGADSPGSIFGDLDIPWNLNRLGTVLDIIPDSIPGVNSPFLYFGNWRAMFPWHTEDMELWSINYIHFGAPKQWYCVPPEFAERMREVLRNYFPIEHFQCEEFIRHKGTMIDPDVLMNTHLIPVYKTVHNQGEFVIVAAGAFHAGFNFGPNCAESVNLATETWSDLAIHAKTCKCSPNTVAIDVFEFAHLQSQVFLADPVLKARKRRNSLEEKDHIKRGQVSGDEKIRI